MNDFTEEELNQIYNHIYNSAPLRGATALLAKIQSMIDNYCEHDYGSECDACRKCGQPYY